jgi:15-cis-phytoene synthase
VGLELKVSVHAVSRAPVHTCPSDDNKADLASDKSTFAPGLRLLPRNIRTDARRLYLILRTLDDLVDNDEPQAAQRIDAVERWVRDKHVDTPETRTLTELSRRHTLPSHALIEFCQGMRHDIARAVIRTEDELELYCQRAGGSVGIMLAHLLGTSRPDGEVKMAILGRAMQRTNILRDIDEDAAHGRTYIARSTIERFGDPTSGRRAELLRDQIARADELYEEAVGASSLLVHGQRGMALGASLYREILRQIERDGYELRPGGATVPSWRRRLLIVEHRLGLCQSKLPSHLYRRDGIRINRTKYDFRCFLRF